MKRWGKAGQRLTEEEIRRCDNQRALRSQLARQREEREDAIARQMWEAGEVKPYRITMALNTRGLYGPEVDLACGTVEPDVDLWEAGKRYPTWEQLKALAKLCGVTVEFFCHRDPPFPVALSSLRFHLPPVPEPPIVWCFTPAAIAAVTP